MLEVAERLARRTDGIQWGRLAAKEVLAELRARTEARSRTFEDFRLELTTTTP